MMRNILTCLCLLNPAPVFLAGQRPDTLTAAAVRSVTLPWRRGNVDLSGAARPAGYVSVIGRRSDVAVHHTPGYQVLLPTPK